MASILHHANFNFSAIAGDPLVNISTIPHKVSASTTDITMAVCIVSSNSWSVCALKIATSNRSDRKTERTATMPNQIKYGPKTSGDSILVRIGIVANGIACAIAEPDITVANRLQNSDVNPFIFIALSEARYLLSIAYLSFISGRSVSRFPLIAEQLTDEHLLQSPPSRYFHQPDTDA